MTRRLLLPLLAACLLAGACRGGDDPVIEEKPVLCFNTGTLDIPKDGGSLDISFSSSLPWKIQSSASWMSVSQVSGPGAETAQSVSVSFPAIWTRIDRKAQLELATEVDTVRLTLNQRAPRYTSISAFFRDVAASGHAHQYICAHRANTYDGIYISKDCPENTVAAIERCIEKGIEMVEIDVRMSKDGVLVCSHDDAISGIAYKGSGNISEMTYAEICQYDLTIRNNGYRCKGQHFNTLTQILRAAKGRIWVNLDAVKDPSDKFFKAITDTLRAEGMLDEVTYYTGSSEAYARKVYSLGDNRLSIDFYVGSLAAGKKISDLSTTPIMQTWRGSWENGDTGLTADLQKEGWPVLSNLLEFDTKTIHGDTQYLEQISKAGVDFIQTDYGDHEIVENYLKSKKLR